MAAQPAVLEAILAGDNPETAVRQHLRTCADCAATAARLGEVRKATSLPKAPPPPPAKPNEPSFPQVIAHVRDGSAGPADIDVLSRLAEANDPRAIEVLAWCKLNGLGCARDPLAAWALSRHER